jgi:hypothetical protein
MAFILLTAPDINSRNGGNFKIDGSIFLWTVAKMKATGKHIE